MHLRSRVLVIGATIGFAATAAIPHAAAFEPPADPRDRFTCTQEGPVPGHPGFPGIANGTLQSHVHSGGKAAAAWSATELFDGPLDVC